MLQSIVSSMSGTSADVPSLTTSPRSRRARRLGG
jgi:hypothetical protein